MENLITNQEDEELKKIRSVLFPAIGIQIITGFNQYPSKTENKLLKKLKSFIQKKANVIKINYLHEDLLEDRLHYMQIKRMLEKYCDQIKIQRIKHEAISRFSSYRLEEKWRADEYFLVDQKPIKEEDVDALIKQNITIIGCGLQNELIIRSEKQDMEVILEQFRLHANKYEINPDTGEYILMPRTNEIKLNPNETWDEPWEIPCITVRAEGINKVKTYEKVRKISFDMHNSIASLIIGNKWDTVYENKFGTLLIPHFKEYLTSKDFRPDDINSDYFANKIFFNWINEVDWKRVAKTIEMYGYMFKDLL